MLVAEAEITRTSEPAETPVICQVAVAVPVGSEPMVYVGELMVK